MPESPVFDVEASPAGEAVPEVAIIIVAYNSAAHLSKLLPSLPGPPEVYEVIVVDNASSDMSAAVVREASRQVLLVEESENVGFARAVNLGCRLAQAEYILLLNPDTIVQQGAIEALLDFARANPAHGVYGGRTVNAEGRFDPRSAWGLPSIWGLLCFATGLSTLFSGSRWFDPESIAHWNGYGPLEVGFVSGGFLLVHRSVWERLGGLDERYFLYGEDADFGYRARKAGYRPVITPNAVIVHEVGGSSPTKGAKMVWVQTGKATYIRQHWGPVRRRAGLLLLLGGVALRAGLSRLGAHRGVTWQEMWAGRREWFAGFPVGPPRP